MKKLRKHNVKKIEKILSQVPEENIRELVRIEEMLLQHIREYQYVSKE